MEEHPLTSFAKEFILQYNIALPESLLPRLTMHIDALIFNMVAVACVVAMLTDKKTVQKEHLKSVEGYVQSKCGTMRRKIYGGMSMPSDFFGYPHPVYSAGNENTNNTHVSQIDFANGIARPAMGPALEAMGGGGVKRGGGVSDIETHMRRVLAYHDMKIAKDASVHLVELILHHLRCFAKQLRGKVAPSKKVLVNESKLSQALERKEFAVFT
jgi:hypothetical protein